MYVEQTRGEFLQSHLEQPKDNTPAENRYTNVNNIGLCMLEYMEANKVNNQYTIDHKNRYFQFMNQFPGIREVGFTDKEIEKVLTAKDFIVNNSCFYVFCIEGFSAEYINCLKFQFTQNFLVNWDTYDKYIQRMSPKDLNHITISTVTGGELFQRDFDKTLISTEDLKSDIQFILLYANDYIESRRNSYLKDVLINHICLRNSSGLITAIIFSGSKEKFEEAEFINETISLTRKVIVKEIILGSSAQNNDSIPTNTAKGSDNGNNI